MNQFKNILAATITAAAILVPVSNANAWNMNFFDEGFNWGDSYGNGYGPYNGYNRGPYPNYRNNNRGGNWGNGNNWDMPRFNFGDGWGPGFGNGNNWGPSFGSSGPRWDGNRRYNSPRNNYRQNP